MILGLETRLWKLLRTLVRNPHLRPHKFSRLELQQQKHSGLYLFLLTWLEQLELQLYLWLLLPVFHIIATFLFTLSLILSLRQQINTVTFKCVNELSILYYQFTPMQSTTNSSQSLMTSSIVFLVLQRSLTHHMKHGRMSIMTSSHGLGTRMWKSRITSLRIKHWIPLLVVPTGGTVPQ